MKQILDVLHEMLFSGGSNVTFFNAVQLVTLLTTLTIIWMSKFHLQPTITSAYFTCSFCLSKILY